MKKTYQMFLALLLMVVGATNVSAEEISLDEVPFWQHEAGLWGLNAPKNTEIARGAEGCAWVLGESTGQPYGDSNVNSFADLSVYTKLVITFSEGTPRVLMNRDAEDGQWNSDEAQSHLIDNTKSGWSGKYFSTDGNVMTVDIKQLVKDKGFAHLHAIKGANWANVTVESMVVVKEGKAKQVGWVNLINNSNMEGDDVSSFFVKEAPASGASNAVITDGVGKDDSRGIVVTSLDKVAQDYDTQFWFRFNEAVPAGTKYRVSFDYKADKTGDVGTQAHAEPSDYIHWDLFGNINFTSDWNTFTKEGEVTADQSKADKQFLSVAFNLNVLAEANKYYFDNIKFEVYKYGTTAEFSNDVILLDFGFETNIPELVKTSGQTRVFYPTECATVKVNGQAVKIGSIEGLKDGRFYIFLEEPVNETDEVEVIFKNPAGDMALKYASGPNVGEIVADADEIADHNSAIEENGGYPFTFVTPTVKKADPENGSFNLPVDLKEFKVTFDKKADCEKLEAEIDGKKLTVDPATGFSESVTFKLDAALPAGSHTMHITKIYPEQMIAEEVYGDTTYTFCTGPSDPTDVPYDVIPVSYFNSCGANSVPEGFVLFADALEERRPGGSYSGGSRMFDFDAGGDFTKGLYIRSNYLVYGTDEEHVLTLEAGKKYNLSLNLAAWKSSGQFMKVQLLNSNDEEVFAKVVSAKPDLVGSKAAVKGSSAMSETFLIETTGNYQLKFVVAKNAEGEEAGDEWHELVLANVKLSYVPAAAGGAELAAVAEALQNAQNTFDESNSERYDGGALTALKDALDKVNAEKSGYTSPSACKEAIELLNKTSEDLKNHVSLCNDYDKQIKSACDVVRQNKETKFAQLPSYQTITTVVAKYNGSSEWVNVSEDPEVEVWELRYTYDVLKDDEALTAAIGDLQGIVDETSHIFTEGGSKVGDAKLSTGTCVLVERLRLGSETLLSLGRGAEDEAVKAAVNALTDDEELATMVKNNIKLDLYGKLKETDNTVFAPKVIDEELGTVEIPTYDMTVFFKNPNTYQLGAQVYSEEMVPGWVVPEGFKAPALTSGWNQIGTDKWATDCMFQTYNAPYRVEQTVTDLPAGIYTVKIGYGEREGDTEEQLAINLENCFGYVKTSATEEGTDGITVDAQKIGQSFPYAATTSPVVTIENITVTDGQLTVGVNAGDHSHTFFNDIQIIMTAAAPGFDYGKAYNEVVTGVEAAPAAQKVVAIQLFDLNGRQVKSAAKGMVIIKKQMSDGSIKVEKVIK